MIGMVVRNNYGIDLSYIPAMICEPSFCLTAAYPGVEKKLSAARFNVYAVTIAA
jgi:hypothetical protein